MRDYGGQVAPAYNTIDIFGGQTWRLAQKVKSEATRIKLEPLYHLKNQSKLIEAYHDAIPYTVYRLSSSHFFDLGGEKSDTLRLNSIETIRFLFNQLVD